MKRSDIIRSIQVKFKRLSAADAGDMMDSVVARLADAVATGDRVEIRGFGTFQARRHAPKATTNPRTGAPMNLSARRNVLFRPSKELIKKMNW
jgi:integration host factor subunit beta